MVTTNVDKKQIKAIDFKKQNLPLEPYFLGLWLGDVDSRDSRISNLDNEIDKSLDNPDFMDKLVYQHNEIEKALNILKRAGFENESVIEHEQAEAEIQGEILREREMLKDC